MKEGKELMKEFVTVKGEEGKTDEEVAKTDSKGGKEKEGKELVKEFVIVRI